MLLLYLIADSGYFVDIKGKYYRDPAYDWSEDPTKDKAMDFSGHMRRVFTFANMSAGTPSVCLNAYKQSTITGEKCP